MKNYKYLSNMTSFAISCLFLVSCNPTVEPTPEVSVFVKSDLVKTYELGIEGKNYSLIGDTILPYQETKLHPLPSTKPDLSNISNNNGTFRYVAIGASLTSGVKDGGWANDGMITSYPNLTARQIGIADFKQALFNDKEFNGYGLKLPTNNNETPVQRYKAVSNNLAFKPSGVEMILTPYEGIGLNNFSVPYLIDGGIYDNLANNSRDNIYYKIGLKRILQQPQSSIESQIKSADLVSIESYQEALLRFALSGGIDAQQLPNISYLSATGGNNKPYEIIDIKYTGGSDLILFKLYSKGVKNFILLNVPNILNFPYFKSRSIRFSQIKAIFDRYKLTTKDYGYDINDDYFYFPNSSIDSLFKYQNDKDKFLEFYLKKLKTKVLTKSNEKTITEYQNTYNEHINFLSKKYSTSIVDVAAIYEKISSGIFIGDGGRKVTDKEFFSSDGLYPSAYGQAIVANECIKTINAFYKTKIELINTDFYLKK